jgi:hypothetical protein
MQDPNAGMTSVARPVANPAATLARYDAIPAAQPDRGEPAR